MDKTSLSVVILTKNEEERIADCIKSVYDWADEIIIVDDESTDRTTQIAAELGVKVLVKKMDIEGRHRNWAYSQAKNNWTLSLDADERPTQELKKEIADLLNKGPDCNAYTIPRRNYIGDRWLKWGGLYPSAQVKLFRKDKFRWKEEDVHPEPSVKLSCRQLGNDLVHYSYRDWQDYLNKLNNQTTLEAKKWLNLYKGDHKKVSHKMNLIHALWRTLDRFVRVYIIKRGFMDGFYGFMVAYLSSIYQLISYAKYKEMIKENRG